MISWRTVLLLGLAGGMVCIMVTTWGSVGSVVMAFGLISMASALLYQHFLNREDRDQWDTL